VLTAGTVALLLVATPVGVVPAGDGSGCAVVDSIGQCLVAAVDPGRPGGPRDRARRPAAKPAVPARQQQPARMSATAPALGAPGGPAPAGWLDQQARTPGILDELRDTWGTPPGPAPGATPGLPQALATLTQQTIERLTLHPPALHTSAGERGLVGVPIWLWIDAASAEPITTTAVAGAAEVTATAQLTNVTWEMGPPGAVVRCTGPGTPWTGGAGPSPTCGYVYALRSLPERTAGRGTWTITATCTWTVTFTGTSAGAPVAAEQEVSVATTTELPVGEVQVLVGGDGS
jgi:hypothetical protein